MRRELLGILHKDETILYTAEQPETVRGSVFGVELTLFLFLGSFFIIAILAVVIFGALHGESWQTIFEKSTTPLAWLLVVQILIAFMHKSIAQSVKLTSVVITEERLFMAPSEDYVRDVGWEGPNESADIVFADQLSVVKGTFAGAPSLIFSSIDPFFLNIRNQQIPIRRNYIVMKNIDEAFEYLPVFLKVSELQFDDKESELPMDRYKRAVDFLATRKLKLGIKQ